MRIHLNLKKALQIVTAVEKAMQASGLHVHGLSGDDLANLTTKALQTGHDVASAVKSLGMEVKAAAAAPEVTD